MAHGRAAAEAEPRGETVEEAVARLRPKSLRLQLRYLRTLAFAFLLFGRLIFWQVYVARYFPNWVNSRNNARWRKYAREFRGFALSMGGVMIKAGQFASTRADVLPEEIIAELASLQDEVPTVAYKQIRSVMERELGPCSARYAWIDEVPVAAASLGQVHRAQLLNNERVVIKVQRPGIRDIVYTDLRALFIVARVAMRFSFVRRRADAVGLIDEFGRVLLEEVSYHTEQRNAERFQKIFAEDPGVYVPKVYGEHSTDMVLTMEDVTSIKINDFEALAAAGVDRKEVAQRLMDTYMQQIFHDRFFHADPHPGNLFVYPLPVPDESAYIGRGGRPFYLIFIDFGMTGTLTPQLVQGILNTLTAVLTRDEKKLVASYKDLGFLLPGADTARIEEATRTVFDQVWGLSMTEMTSMDFEVVANIGAEFNDLLRDMPFRVPQDFIYLGRTVGILSGMATSLDPEFNPWVTIQQNMQDLITNDERANFIEDLGSSLLEPLNQLINHGPAAFLQSLRGLLERYGLINQSEKLLRQIMSGEVQIETRLSQQHRRQLERIEAQGKRSTRAFLSGSLFISGTLFYTSGDPTLALLAYGLAGLLFVSMLFTNA